MPRTTVVLELDDFSEVHHCLPAFRSLLARMPNLRWTLFSVPAELSPQFLETLSTMRGFFEYAWHGWDHRRNECASWTVGDAQAWRERIRPMESLFVPLFRAPYWQVSSDLRQYLSDSGFVLADHPDFRHHNHPGPRYFMNWDIGEPFPEAPPAIVYGHGHANERSPNSIAMPHVQANILALADRSDLEFAFLSEALKLQPQPAGCWLSGAENAISIPKLLTVLIPTHVVPSAPSTDLFEVMLNGLQSSLDLSPCRTVIFVDQDPDKPHVSSEYHQRIQQLAAPHGFEVMTGTGCGLRNAFLAMAETVDTPYYMLIEHDWKFSEAIALAPILHAMEIHSDRIHHVRFNQRANAVAGYDRELKPVAFCPELPLLTTTQWSNNPHVGRTSMLRDQWIPRIEADSVFAPHAPRTSTGIEQVLTQAMLEDLVLRGFEAMSQTWGCCIYGSLGDLPRIVHLDGTLYPKSGRDSDATVTTAPNLVAGGNQVTAEPPQPVFAPPHLTSSEPALVGITTVTLGRTWYLRRCIEAMARKTAVPFRHVIVANGSDFDVEAMAWLKTLESDSKYVVLRLPENKGVTHATNAALDVLQGTVDYWLKLDDDVEVLNDGFLERALDIYEALYAQTGSAAAVLSAFPVGPITHLGGVKGYGHKVIHSTRTDRYYTLRLVGHTGGACRMAPWPIVDMFGRYPEILEKTIGAEDSTFSRTLRRKGILFAYLENDWVFQEMETRLGQAQRMPEYQKQIQKIIAAANQRLTDDPETLKKILGTQ